MIKKGKNNLESKIRSVLKDFSILDEFFPKLNEFIEMCDDISKNLEKGETIGFKFTRCSDEAGSIYYPRLTAELHLNHGDSFDILKYEPRTYLSGMEVIYPEKFNAKSYVEFLRSLNKP